MTSAPENIDEVEELSATFIAEKLNEGYQMESVLGERIENGRRFYYVSWKGYPTSYATWEPANCVKDEEMIKIYKIKMVEKLKALQKEEPSKPPKVPALGKAKRGRRLVPRKKHVCKVISIRSEHEGGVRFFVRFVDGSRGSIPHADMKKKYQQELIKFYNDKALPDFF